MNKPSPATSVRKTPNFDFLFGKYSRSNITIPYFQVNMTFSDAASYLSLVSDMPGSSSMEWRIEELFQRDIDWTRVQRKIVPYLKQNNNPQFFNALTIALLPFQGSSLTDFTASSWKTPNLEEESRFAQRTSFGPIRCGFWQEWDTTDDDACRLGQLAWNLHQVAGIAIDGQHRLAAIKRISQSEDTSSNKCSIPVIFVVLDPQLGYSGSGGREGLIGTLRQLFIDLNKHAKVPSRGRQILLDDRDPASRCVRACVGTKLSSGRTELDQRPPRFPLTLVDWHSEQAKFDEGPYLATVLGLDWAIAHLLNIGSLQDMLAYDQVAKAIGQLERHLEVGLDAAKDRLSEDQRYERPFGFCDDELNLIERGFQETWSAPLIHFFTALSPYRELLERRSRSKTLSPEFSNWYALKQRADQSGDNQEARDLLEKFQNEIANREKEPIAVSDYRVFVDDTNTFKQKRGLAFTVVFQRALVGAYRAFLAVHPSMLSPSPVENKNLDELVTEGRDETEPVGSPTDHRLERAIQMCKAINQIIGNEPQFLMKDFSFDDTETGDTDRLWVGSLVQMEGGIDFSQAASKRGQDLLLFAALMYVTREFDAVSSFNDIVERIEAPGSGLDRKLFECFGRLINVNNNSVGKRILDGREYELTEENSRKVILPRLRWLWLQVSRV